jgi:hypothetical protein
MKRCFAVLAGSVVACSAGADTVSFTLDTEFSGAQQPAGHLVLTFSDIAANHVRLTIQGALENAGQEKATGVYINVDPALVGSTKGATFDMNFVLNGAESSGVFTAPGVSKSVNNHKADGDGYFDVLFSFANGGGGIFNGADKAVFDITSGSLSFDANSFDFLSHPSGGGHGPFHAAAHIQGVSQNSTNNGSNTGGSGWIAPGENPIIPLPQPVLLAGAGLFALAGMRRR